METNKINDYKLLLDQFISLFKKIKDIISINLNDAFKSRNYDKILKSQLIEDTEILLSKYNYDINKILNIKKLIDESDSNIISNSNNYFIKLSLEYEDIINNNLIINKEDNSDNIEGHFIKNIDKNKIFKIKKEYEVKKLSDFIKSSEIISDSEILMEIGCGKSYLTDALISINNNKLLYIGIDMNKNVIEGAKKIYKNYKNVYLLNKYIDFDNFRDFYENNIKNILSYMSS